MTRVKRGVQANRRRKRLLKHTKGFMWRQKTNYRAAKESLLHAWTHQFSDRKKKKRNFRRVWQVRINAAARMHDIPYSRFIAQLKAASIELDRKMLSDIAEHHPDIFKQIVMTK